MSDVTGCIKKYLTLALGFSLLWTGCEPKQEAASGAENTEAATGSATEAPPGMVWIPGGEFTMGTNDPQSYETEQPAHRVRVKGFWMDLTEVTNEQYKAFVDATHYVTVAERKPEWEELKKQLPAGTPKPDEARLVPGSMVFTPPGYAVSLNDYAQWWTWTPGADWKHPEGPGSSNANRMNHPVVHLAYEDATAYCKWAGKRLPTEAEWEYASRGGRKDERYSWGSEFMPGGKFMANTFQGAFPSGDTGEDGYLSTSPVKKFPPNDFGLYDMIGNVWEWTSDLYNVNYYAELARQGIADNPTGPAQSYDPREPLVEKRVTRGGSFLCSNNYCVNYRPSARQGTAFDSGTSHIGFRCVRDK